MLYFILNPNYTEQYILRVYLASYKVCAKSTKFSDCLQNIYFLHSQCGKNISVHLHYIFAFIFASSHPVKWWMQLQNLNLIRRSCLERRQIRRKLGKQLNPIQREYFYFYNLNQLSLTRRGAGGIKFKKFKSIENKKTRS